MSVVPVLFVCVENSNRSQMAEAFARLHGAGVVEPASAGSRPSGVVSPRAIAAMRERGYDLSVHRSKSLQDVGPGPWEYLITMGCGDECPWVPTAHREDWALTDPRDMSPAEFSALRDDIERRVRDLIERVRSARQDTSTPPG
jgi:arsenate reductase (thioredoxin)